MNKLLERERKKKEDRQHQNKHESFTDYHLMKGLRLMCEQSFPSAALPVVRLHTMHTAKPSLIFFLCMYEINLNNTHVV